MVGGGVVISGRTQGGFPHVWPVDKIVSLQQLYSPVAWKGIISTSGQVLFFCARKYLSVLKETLEYYYKKAKIE